MTHVLPNRLRCEVVTQVWRDLINPDALEFEVMCVAPASDENGPVTRKVGSLKGFAHMSGEVPLGDDLRELYPLFDSRSGTAVDGMTLLLKRREAIARAAHGNDWDTLDGLAGFVFCDRLYVHPSVRGQALGLRLLREIRQIFGGTVALMMLKADPDNLVDGDEDGKAFARYLLSDQTLALGSVSSPTFPGWLAGLCMTSMGDDRDYRSITLKVTAPWQDIGELSLDSENAASGIQVQW